jgi:hypothetical protein
MAPSRLSKPPCNKAAANGLSAYTPFDSGNVQGYHCSTPQAALLVFRGTSNIGQWIRDARVLPKACAGSAPLTCDLSLLHGTGDPTPRKFPRRLLH